MTSGGARARSGPPPDPLALRRGRPGDAATWTLLPAEGREGEPPQWPLTDQTDREAQLWARLWRKPQAVQWEALGVTEEVALYVRRLAEAELPASAVALSTLVRQLAESLGLSVAGLRVNRWKVAAPSAPTPAGPGPESDKEPAAPARTGARSRFAVIAGDGAA